MDNSVIDYLFGILGQEFFKPTVEHKRCIGNAADLYEKLKNKLHGSELVDFEKLCENLDGVNAEESEIYFKLGFRFAVKLMAECVL